MSFIPPPRAPKKPGTPTLSLQPKKPALSLSPIASTSSIPLSQSQSRSDQPEEENKQRLKQLQKVIAGLSIDNDGPVSSPAHSIPMSQTGSSSSSVKTADMSPVSRVSDSSSGHNVAAPSPIHLSSSSSSDILNLSLQAEGRDDMKLVEADIEDKGRLGEGSAGEVRKVLHKPTGLLMAKKSMTVSPNPDIHKQIMRELAINRECAAPYIVKYYGAYLEDAESQIHICMEYCEGGSLDSIYKQIKRRNGRTGEKILGKVAEAVLNGLVYLHDRKIIHRDIKPSNILVSRDGQIKLCDFGVSGELINSLAKTFVGTSYYMAPERIRGAPYTWTSDIWSLGLTIHEVAMNKFPFPPDGEGPLGPIELLTYIIKMDPPELKDEPSNGIVYKKAIRDFLRLCLEKEPSGRPNPKQLLQHPWIKKSAEREVDLKKWISTVWEWQT